MHKELAEILFPNIKDRSYYDKQKENKGDFVTRFAPSPTGFIHIGSLYTAFINYLYSSKNKGHFYIRIEDTDSKRKIKNGTTILLTALANFNLINKDNFNKSNIQSKRKEIYQSYVKYLIEKDLAYPCFLSKNEIKLIKKHQKENKEDIGIYGKYAKYRNLSINEIKKNIKDKIPYVIRFKANVNNNTIRIKDLILGELKLPENKLDFILLKEDMTPTYHLAHVIDDTLMGTTHVIRGDEWIPSLPIHYSLYKALNFPILKYAHLSPLTKNEDGKLRKISKRKDKEANVSYFKDLGYPKEALFAYFGTLINPNFENWYFQNYDKSIDNFNFLFNKMPKGGTLFDIQKLNFISKFYISKLNKDQLFQEACIYYQKYDQDFYKILKQDENYSRNVLNIERERKNPRKDIKYYSEIKDYYFYMFEELFNKVPYTKNNLIDKNILIEFLKNYDENDDKDTWYQKIKDIAQKLNYAPTIKEYKIELKKYKGHIGDVCGYIRYVITKKNETPDLYEILKILKKETIKNRINFYINNC